MKAKDFEVVKQAGRAASAQFDHYRSVMVAQADKEGVRPRIYLAGPDVFFPGADAHFDRLEQVCKDAGFEGVRPSDGGLSQGLSGAPAEIAARIYQANIEIIRSCNAIIANLQPFRSPVEPDSGTVFELGVGVALGLPVHGYLPNHDQSYDQKVAGHFDVQRGADGTLRDRESGMLVEEFGQPLNLMISCSTRLHETFEAALQALQEGDRKSVV